MNSLLSTVDKQFKKVLPYMIVAIGYGLLLSSLIFVPFIIFFSPLILTLYLLCKYTRVGNYVISLYDWLFYKSDKPRKFLWKLMYNILCLIFPHSKWTVMNYGYAVINESGKTIDISEEKEGERFGLQLYNYVATCAGKERKLQSKEVLEVGSGRGGGISFVAQNLKAKRCYGIDVSDQQVAFCKRNYSHIDNLEFVKGDSESFMSNPEFKDKQFDLVFNVESSHCYGNFKKFISQVEKALKPGGYFSIADFRDKEKLAEMEADLNSFGLKIVVKEDITLNVLHALKLDEKRKQELITKFVIKPLRPFFVKFSGMEGSAINTSFNNRDTLYMVYVLQKPIA